MKSIYKIAYLLISVGLLSACVDQDFVEPQDGDSESLYTLALDTDEGGTYESETDYGLEIAFLDYLGDLPSESITLEYEIKDVEGMEIGEADNQVHIKEVIYEIDDCTEGELAFTFNAGAGTITIEPDPEIGMPEAIEVVFSLPFETVIEDGEEEEESLLDDDIANEDDRGFVFEVTGISAGNDRVAFSPITAFEFVLLDDETIATEWVLDISDEEVFNQLKLAFSPVSADLADLSYEEVDEIKMEFEYEEMKLVIALIEEEEDECEAGEFDNVEIEIEADYDAEDGELELEGSYFIMSEDDGEPEDELDFLIEASYEVNLDDETLTIILHTLEDEDNFGEEAYYRSDNGIYTFTLEKD